MKKLHWTDFEFDRTYFLFILAICQRFVINVLVTLRGWAELNGANLYRA